jgi:transposase
LISAALRSRLRTEKARCPRAWRLAQHGAQVRPSSKSATTAAYERPSKLDPFVKVIDALIESTPRITAKRIGAIIKQQHDTTLTISAATLRKYVARRRRELVPKEAVVRAQHVPADQALFDFSPMEVIIAGLLMVVQVFAMRLSYSGAFFARASYTEDRPALFAGLLAAVKFFGGLARVAMYDHVPGNIIVLMCRAWLCAGPPAKPFAVRRSGHISIRVQRGERT